MEFPCAHGGFEAFLVSKEVHEEEEKTPLIKEPVARALFPQNAPLRLKRGCPCYAQLADGQFRNFEQPISRRATAKETRPLEGGSARARSKNKLTSGGGGGVSAFPPFFSSVANGRH